MADVEVRSRSRGTAFTPGPTIWDGGATQWIDDPGSGQEVLYDGTAKLQAVFARVGATNIQAGATVNGVVAFARVAAGTTAGLASILGSIHKEIGLAASISASGVVFVADISVLRRLTSSIGGQSDVLPVGTAYARVASGSIAALSELASYEVHTLGLSDPIGWSSIARPEGWTLPLRPVVWLVDDRNCTWSAPERPRVWRV